MGKITNVVVRMTYDWLRLLDVWVDMVDIKAFNHSAYVVLPSHFCVLALAPILSFHLPYHLSFSPVLIAIRCILLLTPITYSYSLWSSLVSCGCRRRQRKAQRVGISSLLSAGYSDLRLPSSSPTVSPLLSSPLLPYLISSPLLWLPIVSSPFLASVFLSLLSFRKFQLLSSLWFPFPS